MKTLLFVIALLWLVFGNFIEIVIMRIKCNEDIPLYSARFLYENTKMNWFGCWFCFVLIRLLIPVNTIIGLILTIFCNIWCFIKWLFTVGRKDEDAN